MSHGVARSSSTSVFTRSGARPSWRRPAGRTAGWSVAASAALTLAAVAAGTPASAARYEDPVGLGTAEPFSVLGASTVANTGSTVVGGDLGVSPGSAVVGFPPGLVGGAIHAADASAASAQGALTTAFLDAQGRVPTGGLGGAIAGGTFQAGVYNAASDFDVSGAVTLDGEGDPNAVFIFQVGGSMTTASTTSIVLIGNAQACNVYWQVGGSATFGTSTSFIGTVMAQSSISLTSGTTFIGRALARTGAVTLDDNVFTSATCVATPTTTAVTATPATAGGSTTLTATVAATGATAPGGTVTFTANGVSIGTAAVGPGGIATLSVPVSTAGDVTFAASFGGLGSYTASSSPTTVLTVAPAAPVVPAATPVVAAPTLGETGPGQPLLLAVGASALMLAGAGLAVASRRVPHGVRVTPPGV